ncbi:MAG: Lrp/AsnC ligand binding domain-containing protein [Promethearchaeota archaeon]
MVQEKIIAYMLIEATTRGPDEIVEYLKGSPIVTEAWIVYGDSDVVARIECGTFKELTELIFNLRKHPELKNTKTLICSV